ncbi:hypothetical protein PRJ39_22110 [Lysobacter enzymogenes]|uniref:hypothetical protein n=1 Tax=Lysobacter enzymogenes TaxID=69 RepID=UPI00374898B6
MTSRFRSIFALACAAMLSAVGAAAQAQIATPEGALDRGFGVDGLFLDDSADYGKPNAFAVQRDGKIVIAAMAGGSPTGGNCRVLRLRPDGTPDPGFGEGGKTWIGDPAGFFVCHSLAVRADGRIVIAGYGVGAFVAVRLLADGSPDPGFGDRGVARADFADLGYAESGAQDAALQADGKLVMVGEAVDYRASPKRTRFAILRYGEDGRLDPGFGDGGRVLTAFDAVSPTGNASAHSVAIQADGGIVAVGSLGGVAATGLARYLPDGRLDPSFGDGGRYAAYSDELRPGGRLLAVQADGRLLLIRGTREGQYQTVVRHLSDGRIDPSFQQLRYLELIDALKQQADGRILVVGSSGWPGLRRPELLRLNHDGTRDEGFVREPFGFVDGGDYYQGAAVLPGGKILLLAESLRRDGGGRGTLGVARLRARTHCIVDALDPGRFLGFSPEGWFAAAGRGREGRAFGALGRGRASEVPVARLHLFQARAVAGVDADAAVFAAEPGQGWGLGRVRAAAPDAARFAILDPRLDDSACSAGGGR